MKGNSPAKAIKTAKLLIPTLNDFVFDNKFFRKIKRTAMGRPAATSYAKIIMGLTLKRSILTTPDTTNTFGFIPDT